MFSDFRDLYICRILMLCLHLRGSVLLGNVAVRFYDKDYCIGWIQPLHLIKTSLA